MKQDHTTAPKKGKAKSAGHAMGGLFGAGPKKTEPDNSPRTRSKESSARMKRIENKFL